MRRPDPARERWTLAWRVARSGVWEDVGPLHWVAMDLLTRTYGDPLQRPLWKRLAWYRASKVTDPMFPF